MRLTERELLESAFAGVAKHVASLFRKGAHRWEPKPCPTCGQPRKGWREHIEGEAGERFGCKFLDRYYEPKVDTFKRGGDQAGFEIRTRSRSDYQLFVRPDDPDDRPYMLVRGVAPDFEAVGWMLGRDAKRDEWLGDPGGYGKPVHLVPDDELSKDWDELQKWIDEHK